MKGKIRYPGQPPDRALVLSQLRVRSPILPDDQAAAVWRAFVGERPIEAALGELVYVLRLYETGRGAA